MVERTYRKAKELPKLFPSERVEFDQQGRATQFIFLEDSEGRVKGVWDRIEPPNLTKAERKAGRPRLSNTFLGNSMVPGQTRVITTYSEYGKELIRNHKHWQVERNKALKERAKEVLGEGAFAFNTTIKTLSFFMLWIINLFVVMGMKGLVEEGTGLQAVYTILYLLGFVLFFIFLLFLGIGLVTPWRVKPKNEATELSLKYKRS